MANKAYDESAIQAIANAIRTKNGTTTTYKVSEMADAVKAIAPKLQAKTIDPATSTKYAYPDDGYDGLSQVTVNAIKTVTQATPTIEVSGQGLITAKSTQNPGYVSSGTKSATYQLDKQAGKIITPSTSQQTAVASGKYTTGTIYVSGDTNLKAENIKKGTSIFGITGTLESGGSGNSNETWVFLESIDISEFLLGETEKICTIPFTSNGKSFTSLKVVLTDDSCSLYYDDTYVAGGGSQSAVAFRDAFDADKYRKITFLETPDEELKEFFLEYDSGSGANAVKQPSDQAIQTDKSITITSNGTTTITPDAPFDAMSKVDLTVNAGEDYHKVKIYSTWGDGSSAESVDIFVDDDSEPSLFINNTMKSVSGGSYAVVKVLNKIAFHLHNGYYYWLGRPTILSGNPILKSGQLGTLDPVVYEISGDCTFSDIGTFGCIIAGTFITLADGSKKPIENITYDDELLVWDFYNGCFASAKPCWIKIKQTATEYNRVTFSDGTVISFVGEGGDSGYHRIFNGETGTFTHTGTRDTPNGTHAFCEDMSTPTVVKQEIVHETVDFYNIITNKHFNLFANGILTSCRLSNLYKIQDMKYIGERLMGDETIENYFDTLESIKKR